MSSMTDNPVDKKFKRSKMQLNRFLRNYYDGPESVTGFIDALIAASNKLTKATWNHYRSAFIYIYQQTLHPENSQHFKKLSYEVARQKLGLTDKPDKQQHCKKVSEVAHQRIVEALQYLNKEHSALAAVITIARETGARPAEIASMKFSPEFLSVSITGAKKTEDGSRGLDRAQLFEKDVFDKIKTAHEIWSSYKYALPNHTNEQAMKLLQNQLAVLTKKIWPKRKRRITLKSYRHQLGSNLKASGRDRIEIAAIMGHQSVDSVTAYGNARSSTREPSIRVSHSSLAGVRKVEQKPCRPEQKRKTDNQFSLEHREPRILRFHESKKLILFN